MQFKAIITYVLPLISFTTCSKILVICPFTGPSHWQWVEHFARGLLERGHEITAITNHPTKSPHPNYTEVVINPKINNRLYFSAEDFFALKYKSYIQNILMWWSLGLLTSEHALNDKKVGEIIRSKDMHFDLIIVEQFFHESLLMFGFKFKAPIVTVGTFGYSDHMDRAMGLITPWSYVPHIALPYKDDMNFWERSHNTFVSLFDYIGRRLYYIPRQQKIAEKYFKDISGPLPSVLDLERNISMMLINSHISTDAPRPGIPGLVSVGGAHIKPVKPLPSHIQKFLDEATNGAIYFSIGSSINSTQMPKEKVEMFLETFRRLPYRFIWKYEKSSIDNMPNNLMISNWLPQNDILAHKNIILFMTHGGMFGMQEGIYHGVPFLFMPLFADQHRNAIRSVNQVFGDMVNFAELTTQSLVEHIESVVSNKSYRENVRKASLIFRDNMVPPMEVAMYHIEYVLRHNGAPDLKSAALNLKWYEYLLLDVIIMYFCSMLLLIFILVKITKIVFTALFTKFKSSTDKKEK